MKKPSDKGKKITAAKIIAGVATTAAICLNLNGCVYGPEVPVSENQNPDVYGPPESMTQVDETEPSEEFESEDNENPTVYGPPEDMEESEETEETEETEESDASESDTSSDDSLIISGDLTFDTVDLRDIDPSST